MKKHKNYVYILVVAFLMVYMMLAYHNYWGCCFKTLLYAFSIIGGVFSIIEIVYSLVNNSKEVRNLTQSLLEKIQTQLIVLENKLVARYGQEAEYKLKWLEEQLGEDNYNKLWDKLNDNSEYWLDVKIDNFVSECGLEDKQKREVIDYIISLRDIKKDLGEYDGEEVDENKVAVFLQDAKKKEKRIIGVFDTIYLCGYILIPIVVLCIGRYYLDELEAKADLFTFIGFLSIIISCIIKNNYRVKEIEELKKELEELNKEEGYLKE